MMKELSMHIMDITQNSVRAGATHVSLEVVEDVSNNLFSFSIKDDGCGMSEEFLNRVLDPFSTSRTTRKVGLGLPFLQQCCEVCGGGLRLESTEGEGTYLKATMEYENIDRPPMGDLEGTIFLIIVMNPGILFKYTHIYNNRVYELDMAEVFEVLGADVSLEDPDVSEWLRDNIKEGIAELKEE